MTTIHPTGLAALVADHKPFELIDVRPGEEFKRGHIPGARSIPLKKLLPAKVVRDRKLAPNEPLFVVCQNRIMAGLAAGMLQGAGCMHPVVVDGGMQNWEARGLPEEHSWRFRLGGDQK